MDKISIFLCFFLFISIFYFGNVEGLRRGGLVRGKDPSLAKIKSLVSVEHLGNPTCAGAIIGTRFILTSARCVIDAETNEFKDGLFTIVAGENNVRRKKFHPIIVEVEKIFVPSIFTTLVAENSTSEGDIAVLKLKTSLNLLNPRLESLRLPWILKNQSYRNYLNEKIKIVGFESKDDENNLLLTDVPKSVRAFQMNSMVVKNEECHETINSTELLKESKICTSIGDFEDVPELTCEGNLGAPLIYNDKVIIGVMIGCDRRQVPKVYTRISTYMDFIHNARKNLTNNMRTKQF